jgi:hypothetical protein
MSPFNWANEVIDAINSGELPDFASENTSPMRRGIAPAEIKNTKETSAAGMKTSKNNRSNSTLANLSPSPPTSSSHSNGHSGNTTPEEQDMSNETLDQKLRRMLSQPSLRVPKNYEEQIYENGERSSSQQEKAEHDANQNALLETRSQEKKIANNRNRQINTETEENSSTQKQDVSSDTDRLIQMLRDSPSYGKTETYKPAVPEARPKKLCLGKYEVTLIDNQADILRPMNESHIDNAINFQATIEGMLRRSVGQGTTEGYVTNEEDTSTEEYVSAEEDVNSMTTDERYLPGSASTIYLG